MACALSLRKCLWMALESAEIRHRRLEHFQNAMSVRSARAGSLASKAVKHQNRHSNEPGLLRSSGPIASNTRQGYQYVFKTTDHATRWKEVFLLRSKPDDKVAIRRFNLDVVTSHNKRIIRLRTDRGSEFT